MACTNEAYETGDSRYSYLRTDFAEAKTNAQGKIVSATTDDGAVLTLTTPATVAWASVPDTTYRTLLYYLTQGSTASGSQGPIEVEPVRASRVYVLRAGGSPQSQTGGSPAAPAPDADPVYLQSAWLSANGSYANLSLALMTGVADSINARQTIGIACDSTTVGSTASATHTTYHYRLLYDQGDVPQYYKTTVYASIPTKDMRPGDTLRVTINTYNGVVTKIFGF